MKIVIDIPESVIDRAKGKDGLKLCDIDIKFICNQVANGTPIPKGHGDLIDRNILNNIDEEYYREEYYGRELTLAETVFNQGLATAVDVIKSALTVIPADKGE